MQPDLTAQFLELLRLAATDLPPDVEAGLRAAVEQEEPGSAARGALETILKNVEMARENSTPILCSLALNTPRADSSRAAASVGVRWLSSSFSSSTP